MNNRNIDVVFVAYGCVPLKRVEDHLRWNRQFYDNERVVVHIVTDHAGWLGQKIGAGSVRTVWMPESELPTLNGNRVFSLTKTKNFGIDTALSDGADVVICTDVDVAFTDTAWEIMCGVQPGEAVFPVYHMCRDFDQRQSEPSRVDEGMTGTTAMVADDWLRVRYDERCVGYGADDGLLMRDVFKADIQIIPPSRSFPIAPVVWHVDHTNAAQENTPGSGRPDCWGRAEGFNPDNFEANQKLLRKNK